MSIRIGDPLFSSGGVPGKVLTKNPETNSLKVTRNLEEVGEGFRHGYLKGLTTEDREKFNHLMDDIKSHEDIRERISALKEEVETRQNTADAKELRFVGYLKAELAHLMFSHHVSPRVFDIPASHAP